MSTFLSTAPMAYGGAIVSGGRIDLNGLSGYVKWGDGRPWGETDFSLRLFVNPDALQTATLVALIATGLSSASEFFRLKVIPANPGLHVVAETMDQSGTQALKQTSSRTILTGRENRIVWVDSNGSAKLYINDEEDPADFTYVRPSLNAIDRIMLGACIESGAITSHFDGKLWMAIAHDDALTAAEAAATGEDIPGPDVTISTKTNQIFVRKPQVAEPDVNINVKGQRDVLAAVNWDISPAVNQNKRAKPVAVQPDIIIGIQPSRTVRALPSTVQPDVTIDVAPLHLIRAQPQTVEPDVTINVVTQATKKAVPQAVEPDVVIDVGSSGQKLVTPTNRQFRLELRDPASNNDLIEYLEGVDRGRYKSEINRPSFLDFSMPATGRGALEIKRGREIWLRDLANDTVLDRFDVMQTSVDRAGDMPMVGASCIGILARLGRQYVVDYERNDVDYLTLITEVLAEQNSANPITLAPQSGGWPTTKWGGRFKGISILEALGRIRKSAGGFFRIQNERNWLLWTAEITPNISNTRELRVGVNVPDLNVGTDFDAQVTRLWAFGAGQGDAQLDLTHAGHPTLYIDADNIGTEGVIEQTVEFPDITKPDALLQAAKNHLETNKNPVKRHTVTVAEVIEGR